MPRRHSQTLPWVIALSPELLDLGIRASGYSVPILSGVLLAATAALLWRAALHLGSVRAALARQTLSKDGPDRLLWSGMLAIFATTLALCWIHLTYRAAEQSQTKLEERLRKLIEPLDEQLSTLGRRLSQLEQQARDQQGRVPDHQDGSPNWLQEKTDRLEEKLDRVLQAVEPPTSPPPLMRNTPTPAPAVPQPPTPIPEHDPYD